jgi:PelA/Pel-15E family pectate lyase
MTHCLAVRSRPIVPLIAAILIAATAVVFARDLSQKDRQRAEVILLYQRNNGGWPKNYDRSSPLSQQEQREILSQKDRTDTTFDNGATHTEMAQLAKIYQATGDDRYKRAFIKGLDFTLAAQYANGGWPQFYPKPKGYHTCITFNDGAMIGVLRLLKAIADGDDVYAFVDANRRKQCATAVAKGVQCILKCQIKVDDKKTAWCAQHDAETLAPRKARSYELPSISGAESVGIVKFLMQQDRPSPEVIDAVQCAVAWFDAAKLAGIRVEKKPDKSAPKGYNKVVVKDPSAPPLWARFYAIGNNMPIFCSRDGVPKRSLAEISYERRNGYSWYSNRGLRLLTVEYPAWQRKWAPHKNVLRKGD